jgi:hypothetical protein
MFELIRLEVRSVALVGWWPGQAPEEFELELEEEGDIIGAGAGGE